MRDARKSLFWIAALIIVVVAGDHVLAWTAHRLLVRSEFRYSQLYRGGTNADILILGDSRGVNSFYSPAIEEMTGRKAFNLSYNSMSPPVAEALLLDYLDRNQPPKMVIIEATCAMVDGAVLTELRPYAGLSPRLMSLYTKRHPYAAVTGRIFRLLPLNSGFFVEALHSMRRNDQDWIMRSTLPPGSRAPEGRVSLVFLPGNLEALGRIVQALRQRGIEVRLLIAPYFTEGVDNVPQFLGQLSRVTHPDERVRIASYAGAIADPDAFADHVHLNEQGSRLFLKMLQRDGVLALR